MRCLGETGNVYKVPVGKSECVGGGIISELMEKTCGLVLKPPEDDTYVEIHRSEHFIKR